MVYPLRLSFNALQSTHFEYDQLLPTWEKIEDLSNGGHRLESKKANYVKIRPGENLLIYQNRLARFTYANILGAGINEQTSKLNLGSLLINGQEEDPNFWEEFLSNFDRKNSYWDFTIELFRTLIQYKYAFLRINKPIVDVEIETQYDADNLDSIPYAELIDPTRVINWSDVDFDQNLDWVKLRYITHQVNKFSADRETICTWVYIDAEEIAYYDMPVKVVNGKIYPNVEPNSEGEIEAFLRDGQAIQHEFGIIPITRVEIPDYLWLADQAYLKCIEHLNIDNSRYDTCMTVGYVQRTYVPNEQKPTESLDLPVVDIRSSRKDNEDFFTGNNYVIEAKEFRFNEAVGSSVTTQANELSRLEKQIKDILGLSGYSAQETALEQSGYSKEFDLIIQEIALRQYGRILIRPLNWLLQVAAKARGRETQVFASGLDKFNLDSLSDLADVLGKIAPFEDRIAPTALRLFYSEIQGQMARNIDVDTAQQINQETEQIWRNYNPTDSDV